MKRVNEHLGLAALLLSSNAWLLSDGEGRRFLIDTGHQLERWLLARCLKRAGIRPGDLTAVLLTHRHGDHAGNSRWLRDRYRAPVICHRRDALVLSGQEPRPRMGGRPGNLFEKVFCHIEDIIPARSPVDDIYEEGSWRWGFEVRSMAGHTAGSVALFHGPTGTLFSGDAIIAGLKPLRVHEKLDLAQGGFSEAAIQCKRRAIQMIRDIPGVRTLSSGHGPPVSDAISEKLRGLAEAHERRLEQAN